MQKIYTLAILLSFIMLGCSNSEDQTKHQERENKSPPTEHTLPEEDDHELNKADSQVSTLIKSSATIGSRVFLELQDKVNTLNLAVRALLKEPTQQRIEEAQNSWKVAHDGYMATRLFRQLAINLDIHHPELDASENSTTIIHTNQSRVDQFPLLPGYLDKVQGYPYSGLIHSEQELSESTFNEEHSFGDPAYVVLGFHPLEFMLFGEVDLPRTPVDLDASKHTEKEAKVAVERRVLYIKLLSEILTKDIAILTSHWSGLSSFYFSQLSLIPETKYRDALKQIAEVEIEACQRLNKILKEQASKQVHDNKETIAARISLANEILKVLAADDN